MTAIATPQNIIAAVAEVNGFRDRDIRAGSRFVPHSQARQAAMMLMKSMLRMPHTKIAAALDLNDHTTVSSGLAQAYNRVGTHPEFAAMVSRAEAVAQAMADKTYRSAHPIPDRPQSEKIAPCLDVIPYRAVLDVPKCGEAPQYENQYPEFDEECDVLFSRVWWFLNDRRFRAAIAKAHPELVQPNRSYGRRHASLDKRFPRHSEARP